MIETIQSWGYLAIMAGAVLEGEGTVMLAAVAAQLGYLQIGWVIGAVAAATLAMDQSLFFLGRRQGYRLVRRNARLRLRMVKARRFVNRHPILSILGFRFAYGMRLVIPVAIGAARVSPWLYVPLNITAVACWSLLFGIIGYTGAATALVVIPYLQEFGIYLPVAALLLVSTLFLLRRWRYI